MFSCKTIQRNECDWYIGIVPQYNSNCNQVPWRTHNVTLNVIEKKQNTELDSLLIPVNLLTKKKSFGQRLCIKIRMQPFYTYLMYVLPVCLLTNSTCKNSLFYAFIFNQYQKGSQTVTFSWLLISVFILNCLKVGKTTKA